MLDIDDDIALVELRSHLPKLPPSLTRQFHRCKAVDIPSVHSAYQRMLAFASATIIHTAVSGLAVAAD